MGLMLAEATQKIQDFYQTHPQGVVVIRGATATGKTGLSLSLAESMDIEVVSSDSRQLYRGMTIGTDKLPGSMEYVDELGASCYLSDTGRVPHRLVDMIEPDVSYTAGQWKSDASDCIDAILSRGRHPFVVGGTGLYIDTLYKNFRMPESRRDEAFRSEMEQLEVGEPGVLRERLRTIDPDEAQRLHPHSTRYIIRALEIYHHTGQPKSFFSQRRAPQRPLLMLGLWRDKESTNRRINRRIKEMLATGLIDEVQWLLDQGYDASLQSMQGIGYRQVVDYLIDHGDMDRLDEELKRATHYLAKKQRSRFRRYIADAQSDEFSDSIVHHVITLDS